MTVLDTVRGSALINAPIELVGRNIVVSMAWIVGLTLAPMSLAFPAAALLLTVYLFGL